MHGSGQRTLQEVCAGIICSLSIVCYFEFLSYQTEEGEVGIQIRIIHYLLIKICIFAMNATCRRSVSRLKLGRHLCTYLYVCTYIPRTPTTLQAVCRKANRFD